jgi:hypothetical protein
MNSRDEMREVGYSKEDEYFFKKDQELMRGCGSLRTRARRKLKKNTKASHTG